MAHTHTLLLHSRKRLCLRQTHAPASRACAHTNVPRSYTNVSVSYTRVSTIFASTHLKPQTTVLLKYHHMVVRNGPRRLQQHPTKVETEKIETIVLMERTHVRAHTHTCTHAHTPVLMALQG
eukprot:1158049-Pelagomonas_calceolata.AAC.5